MLLKFSIKNFKSFADEMSIDMLATSIKEHPKSLLDINDNKVLPIAAVFGANASGKSNVFKAFATMCKDVQGVYGKHEKNTTIKGFIFDEKLREEPSEFEISICVEDREYRYGFLRNQTVVYEEWLFEKKFIKGTRAKEKCVFYKDGTEFLTELTNQKEKKEIDFIFSMLSDNSLMLTAIGKRGLSKYSEVYKWFIEKAYIQDFSDDVDELRGMEITAEFLFQHLDMIKDIEELLNIFDESIEGIQIVKEQDGELNDFYEVYSYHLDDRNRKIKIPFANESSGTKKIFSLAAMLVFTINVGMVLFVDELDAKLHPLVLRYLIRLFSNPLTNTGGGQLIFSSHNLICLDSSDLRRDEIWFIEKKKQKSTIFSLYDFKEDINPIRSDLNFGKNYLSGRFGAIPFQGKEE